MAAKVDGQLRLVIRPMYSNPPRHGAEVAAKVMGECVHGVCCSQPRVGACPCEQRLCRTKPRVRIWARDGRAVHTSTCKAIGAANG